MECLGIFKAWKSNYSWEENKRDVGAPGEAGQHCDWVNSLVLLFLG